MTVGTQATVGGLNSSLTNYAVQLRNLLQQISNFQVDVVALGTGGLQALGFSSGDATSVLNYASYLNTFSEIFNGTGIQDSEFDFATELAPLMAGN